MKMTIFDLKSLIAMLALTIFFTACTQEELIVESAQETDLNELALQINASPEYKTVKKIRTSISDELSNFYAENKERIEVDPSILDDFLSSTSIYSNELHDATEQLKTQFDILNTLTEEDVVAIFEIVDNTEMDMTKSCWDFCHEQSRSCNSNCYARYCFFPNFTYQDYLDCHENCTLFVFNTCLDLCE